jgi:hypothetical protein
VCITGSKGREDIMLQVEFLCYSTAEQYAYTSFSTKIMGYSIVNYSTLHLNIMESKFKYNIES